MITIGGLPGTGTTTVARSLSNALDLDHVYAGGIFRDMAEERGLSVVDLNRFAETHPEIDRELDDRQLVIARKGSVVLEGRMSGFLARRESIDSFNVWLTADLAERARRLAEREGSDSEEQTRTMVEREGSERSRYIEYYGFDQTDSDSLNAIFDLVVDTTDIPAIQVAEIILEEYRRWSNI